MPKYGVSFSLHRCSELGIDKKAVLKAAIAELGFKRFRLMSYWDIHEPLHGHYDFRELDWQMDLVAKHKGKVTLCLGLRQPRWPEFHMPKWAETLDSSEWHKCLRSYIEVVVQRYQNHPALASWQLENEALLKSFGFGRNVDYNRKRLKTECELVKSLDRIHPLIMTLSDSWGLPWFGPKPDEYAMSLYRITVSRDGQQHYSKRPAGFYHLRALLIQVIKRRRVFIHELQAEPWSNRAILETTTIEQLAQMGPEQLLRNLTLADSTKLNPIDLWGLEWWYWLKTAENEPGPWNTIKSVI